MPKTAVARYEADIYSRSAILDPYPHYTRLRELGPVVWLPKQKVYALPRYAECKAVLLDDEPSFPAKASGSMVWSTSSGRARR